MSSILLDAGIYVNVQNLIFKFWDALDHRHIEEMIPMMAENIRWKRDCWIEGKAAVIDSLSARPADIIIRHIFTNLIVTQSDGKLTATVLMEALRATIPAGHDARPLVPGRFLADMRIEFVEYESELVFQEIGFALIFAS